MDSLGLEEGYRSRGTSTLSPTRVGNHRQHVDLDLLCMKNTLQDGLIRANLPGRSLDSEPSPVFLFGKFLPSKCFRGLEVKDVFFVFLLRLQ